MYIDILSPPVFIFDFRKVNSCKPDEDEGKTVVGGRLVRARTELMLPPAGSEARWREEVMPGRASGEVMLALTHQEVLSPASLVGA